MYQWKISLIAATVLASSAYADFTWLEKQVAINAVRLGSWLGNSDEETERLAIEQICRDYDDCHEGWWIGHAMINGLGLSNEQDNSTVILSYMVVDAATGDQVNQNFGIASVVYEVNINPENGEMLLVGESNDVDSNFALTYTLQGFEDQILATPMTEDGTPLVIAGAHDADVARGIATNIYLPTTNVCPCDRDGDDSVQIGDMLGFLADWFQQNGQPASDGTTTDFNGDGFVTVEDFLGFIACWFEASATSDSYCP